MASKEAVVTVKVADVEPFGRFIRDVAKAHAHFYAMTVDEVKALPDKAARGLAELQSALETFGAGTDGEILRVDTADSVDPAREVKPTA